jgi:hypothetical protein
MAFDFPASPTVGLIANGYTWDGEKWLLSAFAVALAIKTVKVQKFSASGTYTPSPGMVYCIIECWGGGGGGGGVIGATAYTCTSGGGGAGGKSIKYATAADIGASKAVTVGAGGGGGTNAASGVNGSDTSVGALCVGKGGAGGTFCSGTAALPTGGPGGLAGTGDIIGTGAPGGTDRLLSARRHWWLN